MEKANLTLAIMITISGLVLAGSEAQTITGQFLTSVAGLVAPCAGGWWVTHILRG